MGEKGFSSRRVRDLSIVLAFLASNSLALYPASGADLVTRLFPNEPRDHQPVAEAVPSPEPIDLPTKPAAVKQRVAPSAAPKPLSVAQATPLTPTPALVPSSGSSTREASPEVVASPLGVEKAKPKNKRPANTRQLSRPLQEIGISTAPPAELAERVSKTPANFKIKNYAGDAFGDWQAPLAEITQRPPRYPIGSTVSWAAPAAFHRPLYFEQPNLERYGHQYRLGKKHGYGLPSAIAAAHFFGTIPVLPYLIGAEGATCERDYVLGAYRPGSCNLHRWTVPPISLHGAVAEGAAATGLAFFIP